MSILQKFRSWLPVAPVRSVTSLQSRELFQAEVCEPPLASEVGTRHRNLACVEYDAQQKPLQEELGEDVFVSAYMLLERSDGSTVGVAAWSEGVPSSLPKVEEVAFVVRAEQENSDVFRVSWADVLTHAGALLKKEDDLYPERYRTLGWPDEELLAKLRRSAV